MTMRRTLITGGAGFIGSHLAERLLAERHHITILDDLSTGCLANIAHLKGLDGVTLIIDSVLNETLMEELIRSHDQIYHLASAVGVQLIIDQPVRTIETTFGGTDIVLRYCSRYKKQVLITSSSEVYGKGVAIPFREDNDVLTGATSKHRWAYACAKALDEFLALAHWKETRLPVAIVRLFNTVGPRQTGQYGMVVPRFVQAALKDEPLTVYGDGTQTRCFTHVSDIVDALAQILERSDCFGQVINLGSDQEVSINNLAERTIALAGSNSIVRHIPYCEAYGEGFEDMQRRVPCLGKAQRLLGYRSKRSLDIILKDVMADLRAAPGKGSSC